jgi:hypothetical protein
MDDNTLEAINRICDLVETCHECNNWQGADTLITALAKLIDRIEIKPKE